MPRRRAYSNRHEALRGIAALGSSVEALSWNTNPFHNDWTYRSNTSTTITTTGTAVVLDPPTVAPENVLHVAEEMIGFMSRLDPLASLHPLTRKVWDVMKKRRYNTVARNVDFDDSFSIDDEYELNLCCDAGELSMTIYRIRTFAPGKTYTAIEEGEIKIVGGVSVSALNRRIENFMPESWSNDG